MNIFLTNLMPMGIVLFAFLICWLLNLAHKRIKPFLHERFNFIGYFENIRFSIYSTILFIGFGYASFHLRIPILNHQILFNLTLLSIIHSVIILLWTLIMVRSLWKITTTQKWMYRFLPITIFLGFILYQFLVMFNVVPSIMEAKHTYQSIISLSK